MYPRRGWGQKNIKSRCVWASWRICSKPAKSRNSIFAFLSALDIDAHTQHNIIRTMPHPCKYMYGSSIIPESSLEIRHCHGLLAHSFRLRGSCFRLVDLQIRLLIFHNSASHMVVVMTIFREQPVPWPGDLRYNSNASTLTLESTWVHVAWE